ncbi:MAG TPA: hypothetical protein VIM75_18020 [Ohtaekwangia sp.]|uniref:hypothetical protein n=1 Tax=Ohtaekwangia sp. TaxID=2066019 RepID=UPI002F95F554
MKHAIRTTLLICIAVMVPMVGSYTKEASLKRTFRLKREIIYTLETVTIYNPVKRQCDKTPLITASNARIDLKKLKKRELRWLALSRDLLKRWNGNFHYGDTVQLTAGDPEIDGIWVIQDSLNKRYKNRGDLLFDSGVRKLGRWNNVKISKTIATPVLYPVEEAVLDESCVSYP